MGSAGEKGSWVAPSLTPSAHWAHALGLQAQPALPPLDRKYFPISEMRRLRLSEVLGLVQDHPVWLGLVPETPRHSPSARESPQSPRREALGAGDSPEGAEHCGRSHSREAGWGEGPGSGTVPQKDCQSGVWGGHRPLISRQPEWPEPAAVPMERVAAHKSPDAFLGWRKGLCYLAGTGNPNGPAAKQNPACGPLPLAG